MLNKNKSRKVPKAFTGFKGTELIDKIIDIDQSPIGRTPRSNPATYTGAFGPIRDWFANLPESKARGYKVGRYSFNVKGEDVKHVREMVLLLMKCIFCLTYLFLVIHAKEQGITGKH